MRGAASWIVDKALAGPCLTATETHPWWDLSILPSERWSNCEVPIKGACRL